MKHADSHRTLSIQHFHSCMLWMLNILGCYCSLLFVTSRVGNGNSLMSFMTLGRKCGN